MGRSPWRYGLIPAVLALLIAISGVVSDVVAALLSSWFGPLFQPWIWLAVFGLLVLAIVVLEVMRAGREDSRDDPSQTRSIQVHVQVPSQLPESSPSAGLSVETKPKVHHNLPQPDYSAFIGREKELAQVHRILRPYPHSQEHLVTIDGVGGVGKSALALEVAHRYLRDHDCLPEEERFGAIIWASAKAAVLTADGIASRLQITRMLDDIYTTISIVLEHEDITRAPPNERDGLVARALARQRALLIVDNLETVDDERVNTFLRELPAPTKAIVTGMSEEKARLLITSECQKKAVELTEEQTHKLYKRTGGVPLALVWSIAQIGYGYSASEVLRRLGNPWGDIARFCFEGTVERIRGKSACEILLALAVFATDASLEAVGYVAGFSEDILSRDEGLIELEKLSLANKGHGRFSLLPLTKAYAISLSPDERAFRLRQEEFYLAFCREYGGTTQNWENYSWIDLERQNLIDLMEWCLHNRRWQTLIDLQYSLWSYWELRCFWSAQEVWCQHALEACSQLAVDSPLSTDNMCKKGAFHLALCWVRINQDRFGDARAEANEAIKRLAPIEDWHGVAVAHRHLGLIEKLKGEYEQDKGRLDRAKEHFGQASKHYEVALGIWRRLDNQREASSVLANIGHQLIAQRKYSEARDFLKQALNIRRRIGDKSRISTNLKALGWIAELEGRLDDAVAYYLEALDTAYQVGESQSVGEAKLGLAGVAMSQHNEAKALRLAREALAQFLSLNETNFLRNKDISRANEIIREAGQGIL
jgi:tetratricopeptide (TPR) repeat protein